MACIKGKNGIANIVKTGKREFLDQADLHVPVYLG